MKNRLTRLFILFTFLSLTALLSAQTRPSTAADGVEISRGIKLRPNGVIDIADLFFEVNYYDAKWTIAQQHDRFEPDAGSNASSPDPRADATGPRTISGTLTTAAGPAKYTETVTPVDGGIDYAATFSSATELSTGELSMAFLLPTKSFAGREILIDQQPLKLAEEAAPKGQPRLLEKDAAHEVVLPTSAGSLTISGDFHFMIQDDREWNDARYSMRLFFTAGSGQLKESKIVLKLRLATK